jgi:hypothetical protein
MTDLSLMAATEAALIAALPFLRGTDADGTAIWITGSHEHALDLIGPITTTPGTYDADGKVITPPVVNNSFHANLRASDDIISQIPESVIIATPSYPKRVWS